MTISSKQMETMLVEIITGKEPTLRSPEADEQRARLKQQVDEIHAKGGQVHIPGDIDPVEPGEFDMYHFKINPKPTP